MQIALNNMQIAAHLNYCSNVFSGNTINEIIHHIQQQILPIKSQLSPQHPFAVGLWLPARAAEELVKNQQLSTFKNWLINNDLYVVSINGFPYGNFHGAMIKDTVYAPNWTSPLRLSYTENLVTILSELMDAKNHGSISTLPISYKPWFKNPEQQKQALTASANRLLTLAGKLHALYEKTGQCIHIDLEPEPDCLLESIDELIDFFKHYLFPIKNQTVGSNNHEEIIRRHIRVCYDICHAAVNYQDHRHAIQKLRQQDIRLGKIQVSSALKVVFSKHHSQAHYDALSALAESKYLHQVTAKLNHNRYDRYPDLIAALPFFTAIDQQEWRIHYHLPIYSDQFSLFDTTQNDIIELLKFALNDPFVPHLEIETYTWPQLLANKKEDLTAYMLKEYQWLINVLKTLEKTELRVYQ